MPRTPPPRPIRRSRRTRPIRPSHRSAVSGESVVPCAPCGPQADASGTGDGTASSGGPATSQPRGPGVASRHRHRTARRDLPRRRHRAAARHPPASSRRRRPRRRQARPRRDADRPGPRLGAASRRPPRVRRDFTGFVLKTDPARLERSERMPSSSSTFRRRASARRPSSSPRSRTSTLPFGHRDRPKYQRSRAIRKEPRGRRRDADRKGCPQLASAWRARAASGSRCRRRPPLSATTWRASWRRCATGRCGWMPTPRPIPRASTRGAGGNPHGRRRGSDGTRGAGRRPDRGSGAGVEQRRLRSRRRGNFAGDLQGAAARPARTGPTVTALELPYRARHLAARARALAAHASRPSRIAAAHRALAHAPDDQHSSRRCRCSRAASARCGRPTTGRKEQHRRADRL